MHGAVVDSWLRPRRWSCAALITLRPSSGQAAEAIITLATLSGPRMTDGYRGAEVGRLDRRKRSDIKNGERKPGRRIYRDTHVDPQSIEARDTACEATRLLL